ncbi:MAG: TRAP transporter large permease subunit [Aurantimonas endophytica]|uniref:TRAP transporter large permease n=1 Tax=Aurantimonas endophytica TaxID=1522175 RepID=UPI003002F13E
MIVEALPILMIGALALLLFTGFPVAYVLGGVGLVFALVGSSLGVFPFARFLIMPGRVFGGIAENLVLVAVPMYIFMGTVMTASGVARDLLICLQVLMRRMPGSLSLAVVVMGTILAATTGIVGASVIMITLLALPVMLERGYSKSLATGTIAASGSLGILIPPSIMLVVMADLLATSVGGLFVAALLPGLLLSALYAGLIVLTAKLRPELAPPMADDAGPQNTGELVLLLFKGFIAPTALIVLVLGSIILGWASPMEASGVGAFGAVLLAVLNGRWRFRFWNRCVQETAVTNAMLFMIFIGATVFAFVFRALGGDELVGGLFEQLGLGPWGVLIVMMLIIFALGFFFEWIEITLIVIPLFAPIVRLLDFGDHVAQADVILWFAILMAVNLQTSYLTPPFAITLFYMRGITPPNVKMTHMYRGVLPFVGMQMIALALIVYFPQIALWLPTLVFSE